MKRRYNDVLKKYDKKLYRVDKITKGETNKDKASVTLKIDAQRNPSWRKQR